jgi:hypothetical protein
MGIEIDDELLTKEDCLTELIFGDCEIGSDRHWEALTRFAELGGTQEELRAAFNEAISPLERALYGRQH